MAQPRVHEFAKEVGVPSKEVIAKLKDMGEFVKSSSSTLNPMVLKKLRAEFPAAAAKPAAKAAPAESAAKPAAKPAPKPAAAKPAAKPAAAPKPAAAKPAASRHLSLQLSLSQLRAQLPSLQQLSPPQSRQQHPSPAAPARVTTPSHPSRAWHAPRLHRSRQHPSLPLRSPAPSPVLAPVTTPSHPSRV